MLLDETNKKKLEILEKESKRLNIIFEIELFVFTIILVYSIIKYL